MRRWRKPPKTQEQLADEEIVDYLSAGASLNDEMPRAPKPTAPNPGITERMDRPKPPPPGPRLPNPGTPDEHGDPPPPYVPLDRSLADLVNEINRVESPIATPSEVLALRQELQSAMFRQINAERQRDAAVRALRRILGIAVYGTNGAETDFDKADDLLSVLGLESDY